MTRTTPFHDDHRNNQRRNNDRTSVPNARDELERERELYSAHDPKASGPSPAERHAAAQASRRSQAPHVHRSGETGGFERQRPSASGTMPRSREQARTRAGYERPMREGSGRSARPQTGRPGQSGTMPRVGDAAQYSRASYGDVAGRQAHRSREAGEANAFGAGRYTAVSTKRNQPTGALRKTVVAVAVLIVVAVVGVFGYQTWSFAQPVDITLNGQTQTIQGDERSIDGLLNNNVVSVTPGNYLAVDGSVMRQGDGTRCTATLNGEATDDYSQRLNAGDTVDIQNGTDVTEPYTDSDPQTLPHSAKLQGTGAVHVYQGDGTDGEKVTRTGQESGITADVTTKEAKDETVLCYNVDSKGDKVVALTFDDGPWDNQTAEVLDILEANDAKATFFTVGKQISGREDLIKRAADDGCEIGTHTWDHAEGSGQGVSLIKMSDQERKDEITKGYDAIKSATGQDASTIFRSPGGNFDSSVATSLEGLVTAEIGWNVDTNDWRRPGAAAIAKNIESVSPGHIILMHDGGGDRSQTIAALKEALPVLKQQGFTFVTVQELLSKYPPADGNPPADSPESSDSSNSGDGSN